jgi:acyl-CoA synthetase (AMP-forming)/AMP-acid ligase II
MYAPSDLHYITTIFGLGRLGYTAFMLSPRLPASAVSTLLTACNTSTLFYGHANAPFAQSVRKLLPTLTSFPIPSREEYDSPTHEHTPPFERRNVDLVKEHHRGYLMLHSSGSTGLPKPISFSNKRLMVTFLTAQPHKAFQSVPFSHAHGLVTYVQHIYVRKTL